MELHDEQIAQFGGASGLGDPSGFASAVASPQNVYFYHPEATLFDVAAAYAFHISMSQAFVDGNKRTGLQAAIAFLGINGYRVQTDSLNLFEWIMDLHTGPEAKQRLAEHLRSCSVREGGFTAFLRNLVPW